MKKQESLDSYIWFNGKIDRLDAEKLLKNGNFLVHSNASTHDIGDWTGPRYPGPTGFVTSSPDPYFRWRLHGTFIIKFIEFCVDCPLE